MAMEDPVIVDLFGGAGGLSLGLSRAGFKVALALDHFKAVVATHKNNTGAEVRDEEITESTELPKTTVIVGGPPCLGFSSAGQRRVGDQRNTLVSVFASLIVRDRPRAFVFENVEGFLTGEDGERVLAKFGISTVTRSPTDLERLWGAA